MSEEAKVPTPLTNEQAMMYAQRLNVHRDLSYVNADFARDLERKLAAAEQRAATYAEFFDKHALGPKSAPSCLVCGQTTQEPAIQHMELPGIVVCNKCRSAERELVERNAALREKQYLPLELQELIYETIKWYANRCTYQAPRIGGVAAGCPRGNPPTIDELIKPAIECYDKWERARAVLSARADGEAG